MKKLLLFVSVFTLSFAQAQTTLFQDNFETPSTNWTLNGGTGANEWIINNEYLSAGVTFGMIPDTPNQPGGVTNGPNSTYMHIHNTTIGSALSVYNANFDTGSATNQSATQTNAIVTTNYTNVTLSFIYLCAGASGTSYGVVEYSTNNGSTWTAAAAQYSGVSTWTNASFNLAAFDNQASLKFRFRWVNGNAGSDPAFSVDEVKIVGTPGTPSTATIVTNTLPANTYCANSTVAVPFTVTGTVNAGNIYTAFLSDNTGSFATPTIIGTLTSSSVGSLVINATIPSGLTLGTGYRIRVDATAPATIGTNNGLDITIAAPPTITINSTPADGIMCLGQSVSMTASGAVSYAWSPGASLNNSTTANVVATPTITTQYTVTGSDANACVGSVQYTVTVQNCTGLEEESTATFDLYPNPASQVVTIASINETTIQHIAITDLSGRVLKVIPVQESTVNVEDLSVGKYFFVIQHEGGTAVKSFVKN
jgi:hypothetical protein